MASPLYKLMKLGPKSDRARYQQVRDALFDDRAGWDSHWREISNFLCPTRTQFSSPNRRDRGGKRNQNIIDSTGRFALRTLQSGLHAGMTSPARPWFTLTTPDPKLAAFKPVKEWLYLVTELMRVVLSDSDIYNTLPTVYGDAALFGTAAMSMLDSTEDVFRSECYTVGSYAIGLNSAGRISAFARDYEFTVFQVVESFGLDDGTTNIDWTKLSRTVKNLWDAGNYYAPIPCCWVVQTNLGYDPEKIGPEGMPYVSCHFEVGDDQQQGHSLLRESGFYEFPVQIQRWDVTAGTVYGDDCPGMMALGDVKQLQGMHRELNKAIAKKVSPPMVGAPELKQQKTSIISGDITFVREPQHGFHAAHEVNLDLGDMWENVQQVQRRIERAMYTDVFLMFARGDDTQKTAAEIAARHEEKLIALGPMHDRANNELLDRIIDRTYKMMERRGLIPEPPEEVKGVKLKVEYSSIMAAAQKLIGVNGQDRFFSSVAPLIQVDPSLRFKINGWQAIDNYADMTGIDPRLVRANEDAERMAAEEAQRQRQMEQAAQAEQLAKAGQAASQTPMAGGGTLLEQVMGVQGATSASVN